MLRRFTFITLCIAGACLSACGPKDNTPVDLVRPEYVFPNEEKPDAFHRAYTMTESADGSVRLFTRDSTDQTDIYQVKKAGDGSWSEPERLAWPKVKSNVNPHFSPYDGRLYFASDRPLPKAENRIDMNIWSVEWTDNGWGEAEPLPGNVNSADNETSVTTTADGKMFYVSNHPRGQGGQDIYTASLDTSSGDWVSALMPEHVNSPRVESQLAVTPDGDHLIFYSRRRPKLGMVDLVAVSRSDDEALGGWSLPYNLGPLINDAKFTFGAGISADGETFFFSREGRLMTFPVNELRTLLQRAKAEADSGKEAEFLGLED